jgi:hypothetical protein
MPVAFTTIGSCGSRASVGPSDQDFVVRPLRKVARQFCFEGGYRRFHPPDNRLPLFTILRT